MFLLRKRVGDGLLPWISGLDLNQTELLHSLVIIKLDLKSRENALENLELCLNSPKEEVQFKQYM